MLLVLQQNMLLGDAAPTATVPDVVGDTQAAGTAEIEAEGFVVAVATAYSSTVAAGVVISQDPLAGATAVVGSAVTITVSLGEAPVVESPQGSGGWPLVARYEQILAARKRRKRQMEEDEESTQSLPPVEKEIARFLHKQEREDESRKELERLRALVNEYREIDGLSERVSRAMAEARARQTMAAYRQLDKELKRMLEEEEMAVLMLLLND